MDFVVHVGSPKTGTSSLQRFLQSRSEELNNKHINYLYEPGRYNANLWFSGYAPALLQAPSGRPLDELILETRRRLWVHSTAGMLNVVSAESLFNVDPGVIQRIFAGHRIKVIAYLRNELEFLASSYAQWVQNNLDIPSIADYLGARNSSMNQRALDRFSAAFGDAFVPRLYRQDRLISGDLISDFLTVGLDLDLADPLLDHAKAFEDQNVSLTDQVIAFKIMLLERNPDVVQKTELCYRVFGEMAKQYGERFRLPQSVKETVLASFVPALDQWSRQYFAEDAVFDYHAYRFAKDDAPELSDQQYQTMEAHYLALCDQLRDQYEI